MRYYQPVAALGVLKRVLGNVILLDGTQLMTRGYDTLPEALRRIRSLYVSPVAIARAVLLPTGDFDERPGGFPLPLAQYNRSNEQVMT